MSNHAHILVLGVLIAPPLLGQASALDAEFVFSEIQGEHGHDCGGGPFGANMVASQKGTLAFAPDGTCSIVVDEFGVCETGGLVPDADNGSIAYALASDGWVTLEPGPEEFHSYVRPDLALWIGATDTVGGPSLIVGTRVGAGLSDASLQGGFHLAKLALGNPGTGTVGHVWSGSLLFDGAGGVTGTYSLKSVSSDGSTSTFGGLPVSWSYSVAEDGALLLDGMAGGVSPKGDFFHAVDTSGQEVALFVGLRASSSASNELLGGEWAFTDFYTDFASGAQSPTFCSSLQQVQGDAMSGTFSIAGDEVCASPSGTSTEGFVGSGSYIVSTDGSFLTSSGQPGALNPSGTLGFLVDADAAFPGEVSLSVLIRKGELPAPYGTPTPGTGGLAPQLLSSGGFPYLGNPDFSLDVEDGLANAPLLLCITLAATGGSPVEGGLLWVDLTQLVLVKVTATTGSGTVAMPLPVPGLAGLDGSTVFAQVILLDAGAPGSYAMSSGLRIPLFR